MSKTMRHLILLMGLLPSAALAQGAVENIDALERRLLIALDAGIGEPGGPAAPIDRRLKLTPCPTRAEIDPPALGAIALRCPAVGWRIRVPLVRAGMGTGQSYSAKAAPVIRRGDSVELRAGGGSFQVTAEAVAQEDGAPGDRIRIKTDPKAGQTLFAEVVDAGIVRLPGFK